MSRVMFLQLNAQNALRLTGFGIPKYTKMNSPIILQIKKKETVPSIRQCNHHYRSDWKTLHTIDYQQSKELFASIGNGPISTEAQMAKLLADNYGDGIYMCIAIKKGRRGMWNFLMLKIEDGCFVRIERTTQKIAKNPDKEKRKGPYHYLISAQPVYKIHEFEDYGKKQEPKQMGFWNSSEDESDDNSVW